MHARHDGCVCARVSARRKAVGFCTRGTVSHRAHRARRVVAEAEAEAIGEFDGASKVKFHHRRGDIVDKNRGTFRDVDGV